VVLPLPSTHSPTGTPIIHSRHGLILAITSAPSAYSLLLSFRRREKISKKALTYLPDYTASRPKNLSLALISIHGRSIKIDGAKYYD
jgi:hypothetical protein